MKNHINRKILFLFPRSPLNHDSSNDKRQFLIYSTLKGKFDTRIITFGEEYQKTKEQEVIKLKRSNVKKIFNFLFKLQSPRITHYKSKEFSAALDRNLKSFQPDLIYVEHLLIMQYLINLKTKAKIVFFNDESNWFVKENHTRGSLYQSLRNVGLFNFERRSCSRADLILTITQEETDFLRRKGFSNVETIPYGVDTDFFKFNWKKPKENIILFVGDYSHYPNRQSARLLVRHILPELSDLGVKLRLVGRNSCRIKNLIKNSVEVYDNVPDVRPYYYNSSVFVAPIFSGAGLRVKILEAVLCGIPLIISSIANLGIQLDESDSLIGENLNEIKNSCRSFFMRNADIVLFENRKKAMEKITNQFDENMVRNRIIAQFLNCGLI